MVTTRRQAKDPDRVQHQPEPPTNTVQIPPLRIPPLARHPDHEPELQESQPATPLDPTTPPDAYQQSPGGLQLDEDEDGALGSDEWPASPAPTAQRNRDPQQWPKAKNIALAQAVNAYNPYIAEHGAVTAAWRDIQSDLREAGYDVKRIETIRKHMDELLQEQKRNDAKASRKSGADEPADELVQLLVDINSQRDDHNLTKATTARGRAKATMEREAGAQLRDAAMRGIVDRDTLLDITQLPGSTAREKSGQRKKRRARSPSASDKENGSPGPRTKRARKLKGMPDGDDDADVVRILKEMNKADAKLLEQARDERRAATAQQEAVLKMLGQLVDATRAGQSAQVDEERRRQERREDRQEFMQMLLAMQQMQQNPRQA